MALPNPTVLGSATQFRPISLRASSRSPARSTSPVRRREFIAKELDPILANLSPDSTLRALQSTHTIASGEAGEDVLAKRIASASPAERELGIRSAVAAQKLRQWHTEVAQWKWPRASESMMGKGFLQPDHPTEEGEQAQHAEPEYYGSLPLALLSGYEDRVEEIYAGLDALGIEELKKAVLDSHSSFRLTTSTDPPTAKFDSTWKHSQIKDFTALITATIIQALPDLANLNTLLSSWDIRLMILRQTPQLLENLQTTLEGIKAASEAIADKHAGAQVTRPELETTENMLAQHVSSLGTQFDQMLDLLEGHEDSLPDVWIDTLEKIESSFAQFVVEAKRKALQNEWMARNKQPTLNGDNDMRPPTSYRQPGGLSLQTPSSPVRFPSLHGLDHRLVTTDDAPALPGQEKTTERPERDADQDAEQTPVAESSDRPFLFPMVVASQPSRNSSQRKQPLRLDLPPQSGHRREISEVSMADSNYSALSELSQAEIIDARSTQVLQSPKISLVDNPFRASRDDLSGFPDEASKPRVRSMHILGKEAYTRVEASKSHNRAKSMSVDGPPPDYGAQDLPPIPAGIGSFSPDLSSPENSPSRPRHLQRASTASVEMLQRGQARRISLVRPSSRDSSQFLSQEFNGSRSPSESRSSNELDYPGLPRRSSNRISRDLSRLEPQNRASSPISPVGNDHDMHMSRDDQYSSEGEVPRYSPESAKKKSARAPEGSLEARIQSILTTLPNRIQLENEYRSGESSSYPSTASSTRSHTPAPFTLSPAKNERPGQRGPTDDSGVKVYHLTRHGQARNSPPTKLFVRLVGENGERVMVRVGGGWADLGEYLREYSLHHGRHTVTNSRFQVANIPANGRGQKEVVSSSGVGAQHPSVARPSSLSISSSQQPAFDFGVQQSYRPTSAGSEFTPEFGGPSAEEFSALAREPERNMASSHTTYAPTMMTTTTQLIGGSANTTSKVAYSAAPTSSVHSRTTVPDGRSSSSTTTTPNTSISSTFYSPPSLNQNYTPLGAAGPKNGGRRAVTYGGLSPPQNDAWVDGLVNNARAASGNGRGNGTTTVTAMSTPASRRIASAVNSSPMSAQSNSSHISTLDKSPSVRSNERPSSSGGVSGIRRVFLRKKSKH